MSNRGANMSSNATQEHTGELSQLCTLSARIGGDLLSTQASSGNSSIKLDGVLWIKASGKWMAHASRENILLPLDLAEVRQLVKRGADPAERYSSASIETAMHAVLPHRVVLHVHCVNTIAWAVRQDAPARLERQLKGLPWQWIPYVPSGLPLAREIEKALAASGRADILVLGNHGLVVGGEDCAAVQDLLSQVQQRLAICPRRPGPADYAALAELADGSSWDLPDDDGVHALGLDDIARAILSGGFLYPCQLMFSDSCAPGLFCPVSRPGSRDEWESRYRARPFLIVEGRGVVVKKTMTPAQRATMSGLAQVVQRISLTAPLRYLTETEVANSFSMVASRYA